MIQRFSVSHSCLFSSATPLSNSFRRYPKHKSADVPFEPTRSVQDCKKRPAGMTAVQWYQMNLSFKDETYLFLQIQPVPRSKHTPSRL